MKVSLIYSLRIFLPYNQNVCHRQIKIPPLNWITDFRLYEVIYNHTSDSEKYIVNRVLLANYSCLILTVFSQCVRNAAAVKSHKWGKGEARIKALGLSLLVCIEAAAHSW